MLCACGIQGFWTDRNFGEVSDLDPAINKTSLIAKVKDQPEDFIVVEIDTRGQHTNDPNYQFYDPCVADAVGINAEEDIFVASESNSVDTVVDRFTRASQPQDRDHESIPIHKLLTLQASLSNRVVSLLQVLDELIRRDDLDVARTTERALHLTAGELNSVIQLIHTGDLSCHEQFWWRKEWQLQIAGLESFDKSERHILYHSIRACFRHVRSAVRPVSSSTWTGIGSVSALGDDAPETAQSPAGTLNASCVVAGIDPHYILFVFLFGQDVARVLTDWAYVHHQSSLFLPRLNETPEWENIEKYLRRRQDAGSCFTTASASLPNSLQTRFRNFISQVSDRSGRVGMDTNTLSAKHIRRSFHSLLRRFYPFIKCHVSNGEVTFKRLSSQQPSEKKRPRFSVADKAQESEGSPSHQRIRPNETPGSADNHGNVKQFTYLVLCKRNLDVMEMKQLVARYFSVSEAGVCTAGLKDKKAVTYQRVSIPGWHLVSTLPREGPSTEEGQILRWPSDPQESYVKIYHIAPKPCALPLQIGQLRGNHFRVRLRRLALTPQSPGTTAAQTSEDLKKIWESTVRTLQVRFERVCAYGFVNYFGQQRFSESITDIRDHTGLHLFARRWPEAVQSLYRSCMHVYEAFPNMMEGRYVPKSARDAQVMAHALHRTYRMYFSEHPLTRADVQEKSAIWCRICEKAITESVPFALRSMWVHAAQSVYFNILASHVAQCFLESTTSNPRSSPGPLRDRSSHFNVPSIQDTNLPLGGYHVKEVGNEPIIGICSVAQERARWLEEAEKYALEVLNVSRETIFGQAKVAGVPVPGAWRRLIVRPQDAQLEILSAPPSLAVPDSEKVDASVCFTLPSSSYATVCLREILRSDVWF